MVKYCPLGQNKDQQKLILGTGLMHTTLIGQTEVAEDILNVLELQELLKVKQTEVLRCKVPHTSMRGSFELF